MKISLIKSSLLLGVGLWCLSACHKSSADTIQPVAKGERHLGIHITSAENQDYGTAFTQARSAGVDCIPFTFQWPVLEANGAYDPQGLMNDLNGFFATQPVSLSICVSPIAANRRDLPDDLLQTAFDDPTMIQRFEKLLDTLHAHLSATNVRYLLIGNEVDLYFSQHTDEWTAYTNFCKAVRLHARVLWGDKLWVGAETTLGDAIGTDQQAINTLNTSMDMVCLTYYPLGDDFRMQPVTQVGTDLEKMLQKYPGRQVLMQEVGYATSPDCSGSDTAQASFVREIFKIWDKHADQMQYVAFLWLNDLSPSQSQAEAVYYGLDGTSVELAFTAYIGSLGLCDLHATPKPGFTTLQDEASRRGWKQ